MAMTLHGYEIWGFHLTIDDPVAGVVGTRQWAAVLAGEGRWAMALVQLVLPAVVVPVVPLFLGVAMAVWSWWALCRHVLTMSPWRSSLATALAGSSPVLALTFSFDSISLGIGVAQVMVVLFAVGLVSQGGWALTTSVTAGAIAIGFYEPYLVVMATVTMVVMLHTRRWSSPG